MIQCYNTLADKLNEEIRGTIVFTDKIKIDWAELKKRVKRDEEGLITY